VGLGVAVGRADLGHVVIEQVRTAPLQLVPDDLYNKIGEALSEADPERLEVRISSMPRMTSSFWASSTDR
jgi:hypothetical protein